MNDQRIELWTPFGRINPCDRGVGSRIATEAVDRLGGDRDQRPRCQQPYRLSETARICGQNAGAPQRRIIRACWVIFRG